MSLKVVKVGTSLIRGTDQVSTIDMIASLSECIASSRGRGDEIVLVSSGAVGLGCHYLGMKNRPKDLVSLQAAAAVGQIVSPFN